MAIASETMSFARCLVASESHGRRAQEALMGLMAQPADTALQQTAARELADALGHASKLMGHLLEWTAEVANPIRGASHIDMMDYLGPLNEGPRQLRRACACDISDPRGQIEASEFLSEALDLICRDHSELVAYCCRKDCKVIEIPDIPTTRDGGGR